MSQKQKQSGTEALGSQEAHSIPLAPPWPPEDSKAAMTTNELREFVKIASEHRAQGAEILAKLDRILAALKQEPKPPAQDQNSARTQQERLSQIHQHSLPAAE
jgi:hypothetical protein